jgi:hypothetical protein
MGCGSPLGVVRFEAQTVLGSGENAVVHLHVGHPTASDTADGKAVAGAERTAFHRNPVAGVGPADLNHVIPVANVAILDINVSAPQVDAVGIGRGPGRGNGKPRGQDIGPVAQKLDMELRGILHCNP